mmetsp:Transcript_66548/g.159061  ORF Transcript_66548/g.159061 Transcript_66548/m.159061 type:complete len:380 (-) Transcript_66548:289-1428(-)|eukprot:CAMPEP_0178383632 /NCGR_PEP_ID=MMETSP0689_2-20121128/7100_1 /TAXON_ID=160604 /ORGANISM="Amphidinium massartii, Strain CS-259" /LENGTH=379 /DNA_ID=CAMNT_0020003855 /DNA_START=41 /DNA_END=1180 /DNA_ORIENTATION=-
MGHEKDGRAFSVMRFFTGGRLDEETESKGSGDVFQASPLGKRHRLTSSFGLPNTPSGKGEISPTKTPRTPSAFDVADDLEKGFADEVPQLNRVCNPASNNDKLTRCCIFQSEARSDEYQLVSEDGDALLDAKVLRREQCIEIYTCERDGGSSCGGQSTPAERRRLVFFMTYHEHSDEWVAYQTTCERCANRPHHLTCAFMGKGQQVAKIQHSRKLLKDKDARVHSVDVFIPPLINEQSAPWCPLYCGRDLGLSPPTSPERQLRAATQPSSPTRSPTRTRDVWRQPSRSLEGVDLEPVQFCSKLPLWDDVVQSLVLNFEARIVASSARNFMLRRSEEPNDSSEIMFQHAKMSKGSYCLDYKYPLNAVQAFAIALSSERWD